MANANSSSQSTNECTTCNGFYLVTRSDIEIFMNITYEQSMAMSAMFKTISRLSNDETIKELCTHGALQAELQGDDLDVLRERAMKAGLIGSQSAAAH